MSSRPHHLLRVGATVLAVLLCLATLIMASPSAMAAVRGSVNGPIIYVAPVALPSTGAP